MGFRSIARSTKRKSKKRAVHQEKYETFLNGLEIARAQFPKNLCAKYLSRDLFATYNKKEQDQLFECCKSGFEVPTSVVGAYAISPGDYNTFDAFFDPLIRERHLGDRSSVHKSDWDLSRDGDNGVLDLAKHGLKDVPMRIRVCRNLQGFNLCAKMTKEERVKMEKLVVKALEKLRGNADYGGEIYSLSPDLNGKNNGYLISNEDYETLVEQHIMFKNTTEDPFQKSAGFANDWPYGRGCYVSADKTVVVWYGEEDHLQIISTQTGTRLDLVFEKLKQAIIAVQNLPGVSFMYDNTYGYVTACPSNLGTALRASVHIRLPNLTKNGRDTSKAKIVADNLGFDIRGVAGEHTPIGSFGTVDISPTARLFVSEKDIVAKLFDGIQLVLIDEKAAIIYRNPESSMDLLKENEKFDNQRFTSSNLPFGLLKPGQEKQAKAKGLANEKPLEGKKQPPKPTRRQARKNRVGKDVSGQVVVPKNRVKKGTLRRKKIETITIHQKPETNFAENFLAFVNDAPTPFHVCSELAARLEQARFLRIKETFAWKGNHLLKPGGRYYFTRNGSTLIAFVVGGQYRAGNPYKIIGTHTDSCVLKVKPVNKVQNQGWMQVGVETYGGGLWHTWLDRDLGIAGRVVVRSSGGFKQRLVHIKRPILRVPSPAIHLESSKERHALEINAEDQLKPILGLVASELNQTAVTNKQNAPALLRVLAKELEVAAEDIMDFELCLCDTQPGAIGGVNDELVFAPRIDNLAHCFTGLEAMMSYAESGMANNDHDVSMLACFDNEEVGSGSAQGAKSPILRETIGRISACFAREMDEELTSIGVAKSFFVSADCSHGVHPNYTHKHEQNHRPKLGKGSVIKTNQNQRYATNAITGEHL